MRKTIFMLLAALFLAGMVFAQDEQGQKSALFAAIDEIQAMYNEVEQAYQKHKQALENSGFLKCYYVKRGGIPAYELKDPVFTLNASGEVVSFPEWLANDVAWASDIHMGGLALGGMTSDDGEKLLTRHHSLRLKESIDFLKNNADFYKQHPPVCEMNYLRHEMDQWRRHFVEYRNALDEFFAAVAEFIKYGRYLNSLYGRQYDQLEAECKSLTDGSAAKAKCEVEKEDMRLKRDAARHKAEYELSGPALLRGPVYQRLQELDKVEPFKGLRDVFGVDLMRIRVDNDAIIWREEKLKDKELDPKLRKGLEKEIDDLKKGIDERLKRVKRDRGQNCLDVLRDPKTGEIVDGGYIRDRGLDAVKIMANKSAKRLVHPVGGLKPDGAVKKEPLPEDKLYAFLAGCAEFTSPPKEELGSKPSDWGSGEAIMDDGTPVPAPQEEKPVEEAPQPEEKKKSPEEAERDEKDCLEAFQKLESQARELHSFIKKRVPKMRNNHKKMMAQFNSIVTVVGFTRIANMSDQAKWRIKAEEIRHKMQPYILGCEPSEPEPRRPDYYNEDGSLAEGYEYFQGFILKKGSMEIGEYNHQSHAEDVELLMDNTVKSSQAIERKINDMPMTEVSFVTQAKMCVPENEAKLEQVRARQLQLNRQMQLLVNEYDHALFDFNEHHANLSKVMDRVYRTYDDEGTVDVAYLDNEITAAKNACAAYGRMNKALEDLLAVSDEYNKELPGWRNFCSQ